MEKQIRDKITEELFLSGYNTTRKQRKETYNMSVVNINMNNFQEEVLNSEKPVLLDFWASWCGPCRMVGPILDEIAAERSDIKVAKVNVDEQPELASKYKIMSIPTLMVIREGKVVNQALGARPKNQILDML
jgi:thioredoxin 1